MNALRTPVPRKDVLRRFAESRMVYDPPGHEPWLHGLGEEPPDLRELSAGTG